MAQNSIGTFNFVRLVNPRAGRGGAPELLRERNEVIQRPGVDGTAVRRLGIKANPFDMISGVDVATRLAAKDLFADYTTLTDDTPRILVWNGINYDRYNTRYIVLDVIGPRVQEIKVSAGGILGGGAGAFLEATWRLIPVDPGLGTI